MSATVLRLGLWTLVLVLVAYVIATAFPEEPIAELVHTSFLQQALFVGLGLIAAGIVLKILGIGKNVVIKNRCNVCRTPIPSGAIYCREHLRAILSEEDERTHATKIL